MDRNFFKKSLSDILNAFLPVIFAFLLGGVVILLIHENPLEVYKILLLKSFFTPVGLQNTLHYAGPMILTGLAIAVCFKANLYNMGVEGSLIIGAFASGIVGANLPIGSGFLLKSVCILVGVAFAVLYSMSIAYLKIRFRADEMVVSMMLNYALAKAIEYLATNVFRDTGNGYVCTPVIQDQAMYTRIFGRSRLTAFIFIILLVLLVLWIVMKKSKLGYEIKAMGKSFEFAEAMGMRVGRKICILFILSGALAGLAGAGWMMEDQYRYTLDFSGSPGLGWDGMLIALMGGHDPLGIGIAAIFYAGLKIGADNINMYSSVPKEIVSLMQGMIVLFLSVKFICEKKQSFQLWNRLFKKKAGLELCKS